MICENREQHGSIGCNYVKCQQVVATGAEEDKDSPGLCIRSLEEACSVLRSLQLSSGLQLSPDSVSSHGVLCTVTSAGLVPVRASPVWSLLTPGKGPFYFTVSGLSTHCPEYKFLHNAL